MRASLGEECGSPLGHSIGPGSGTVICSSNGSSSDGFSGRNVDIKLERF